MIRAFVAIAVPEPLTGTLAAAQAGLAKVYEGASEQELISAKADMANWIRSNEAVPA